MATSKDSVQKVEEKRSLAKYFRGVKSEFKKVVWPTKKEIVNLSSIVIVAIIIFSVLLLVYDKIVAFLLNLIIG